MSLQGVKVIVYEAGWIGLCKDRFCFCGLSGGAPLCLSLVLGRSSALVRTTLNFLLYETKEHWATFSPIEHYSCATILLIKLYLMHSLLLPSPPSYNVKTPPFFVN